MPKRKTSTISVQGTPVTIINLEQGDYISLTDMAKARTDSVRAADVSKNWLRIRSTSEFLGTWELMYNPDFKVVEFDHFKAWREANPELAKAERIKDLPKGDIV